MEKKVLRKFLRKKVKPVERTMKGVRHPITDKQLKFTTVNLTVNEQTTANRLFNKGFLRTGKKPFLHLMKVTKKGEEALKNKI